MYPIGPRGVCQKSAKASNICCDSAATSFARKPSGGHMFMVCGDFVVPMGNAKPTEIESVCPWESSQK